MPRAWCQESCARHFSILGSGYHLGAVRATQQREHTSPSLPKESSETHATKSPGNPAVAGTVAKKRSEEHTSELQSRFDLVCRLLLEKTNSLYTNPLLHRMGQIGACPGLDSEHRSEQ